MNSDWLLRTEMLFGADAIRKLRDSTVLIAGLGGVGGYSFCRLYDPSGEGICGSVLPPKPDLLFLQRNRIQERSRELGCLAHRNFLLTDILDGIDDHVEMILSLCIQTVDIVRSQDTSTIASHPENSFTTLDE